MDSLPITFARGNRYRESGSIVHSEDTITDCCKKENGDCHFITAPDLFGNKALQFCFSASFQAGNKKLLKIIQQDLENKKLKPIPKDLGEKYTKAGLSAGTVKDIYHNASSSITSKEEEGFVVISKKKISPSN